MMIGAGTDLGDHEPAARRRHPGDPRRRRRDGPRSQLRRDGSANIASRRRRARRARAAAGARDAGAPGSEPESATLPLSAHRVVFTPSGKRGEFADGTSLLAAARELRVDLDSVCGGRGICGRCQIDIAEGDFAKHAIVFERRPCDAMGRGRGALCLEARTVRCRPEAWMPGQDLRRSRHRRTAGKPGPPASRAQARRDSSDRDRSRRAPPLRRGRGARHARPGERPAPPAAGSA